MYIPEIILTIVICFLIFYLHNKEEAHKHKLHDLEDKLQQEKHTALLELKKELEQYYKRETSELYSTIEKLKSGSLVDELESKNRTLQEKLWAIEKCKQKEREEICEDCYMGLIAIKNTLIKEGSTYEMERCVNFHRSLVKSGQIPQVESDNLTESIRIMLEYEE